MCSEYRFRTHSGALDTRQKTRFGDPRTDCRTVLDEPFAGRSAVKGKVRAAVFGPPMTAASRGSCWTGKRGNWMSFFADKRKGISAWEQRSATMRAAKPRSHPPLYAPTEAAPQSVCRTARNDFSNLSGCTNTTAPLSSVASVDTAWFWVVSAMIILLMAGFGEQRCAATLPVGQIGNARETVAGGDRPASTSGYHLAERPVPRIDVEVGETAPDGTRA
jgi:hypothetical protein